MNSQHRLYRIMLPHCCGGILVDESDKVIEAAPIMRWMIGKRLKAVESWVRNHSGTIEVL